MTGDGDSPVPKSYAIPADPLKAVGAILGHFQGASLNVLLAGLTDVVNVIETYGISITRPPDRLVSTGIPAHPHLAHGTPIIHPAAQPVPASILDPDKTDFQDSPPPVVPDLDPPDVPGAEAPRRWKSGPISAAERERIMDMFSVGNSTELISDETGRSESVIAKVINKYAGTGNSEQSNAFEDDNTHVD